jgi:formamidopyrimidine-DNA glycosylase
MVEIPEAFVLARQANNSLTGKQIRKAIASHWPHKFAWYTGDPGSYPALLEGKKLGPAISYAGHVEIKVEDMVLVLGAGLRYHPEGENPPKKHQLLLEFSDSTAFSACIQMWGFLLCFPEGGDSGVTGHYLGKDKPSPLTGSFDWAYFQGLLDNQTGKLSAKAFLATEQRIPGLGNGVLQDILWMARIHPKRKMASLSAQEFEAMYSAVKGVLKEMALRGGRDTERDLYGCAGGYRTVLSKHKVGMPCQNCGTPIKKEAYLGGSIYYCESCQGL